MKKRPQVEDGFTRIANELLEALARTNFCSHDRRVLDAVLRKTYGWRQKKAWVSTSQICAITGLHKAHVARAKKSLAKRGIVTWSGNKIGINKFYSRWKELPQQVTVTSSGNKKLSDQADIKETKETYRSRKFSSKISSTSSSRPLDAARDDMCNDIFDFFERITSREVRVRSKRSRELRLRLKDFSTSEIKQAWSAMSADPFLRGENDHGRDFLTVDYALRADRIDHWLNESAKNEPKPVTPTPKFDKLVVTRPDGTTYLE